MLSLRAHKRLCDFHKSVSVFFLRSTRVGELKSKLSRKTKTFTPNGEMKKKKNAIRGFQRFCDQFHFLFLYCYISAHSFCFSLYAHLCGVFVKKGERKRKLLCLFHYDPSVNINCIRKSYHPSGISSVYGSFCEFVCV